MIRSTALLLGAALLVTACDDDSPTEPPATATPTITATTPANNAENAARNVAVTATFSEAMDPASINATTFTLRAGATVIPGVVTYVGTTATFVPTVVLESNTDYAATISVGAEDMQGDSLANARTWSFSTVTTSVTGPAEVNLGTAGNFVILAKSGISTTGVTSVVGDIALSPAAASFITGFALSSPATTFSTSALVTGQVFASNYATPTPAALTTAVLDMQAAYTNAAGRTLPDFTELGAGNINAMTLVPGLYKWGTGVSIPISLTLNGGANDVWIFQVGQNLTVGNGAIVTLTGGAQAENVFWQVAGSTTIGTTAAMKGIILSQTLISMNTGAAVVGRALAQTAVTMNASTVVNP